MPRDPVCGMNVREDRDSIRSNYKGQTYYFCCDKCRSEFDRNPDVYANANRQPESARRNNEPRENQPRY